MINLLILILAVIIDLAAGDPPNAFHPVAWMGWVIGQLEKIGLRLGKYLQLFFGAFITLFVAGLAGAGRRAARGPPPRPARRRVGPGASPTAGPATGVPSGP